MRSVAVDLDLLIQLADGCPSLAGTGRPVEHADGRSTERPNVHWFDQQPHEAIPAFGRGFDVALMPWHDNEWIRNCNPVKIKEYLALDLPMVTIDFPEVRRYEGLIDIAVGYDDFIAQCRKVAAAPERTGAAGGRRCYRTRGPPGLTCCANPSTR